MIVTALANPGAVRAVIAVDELTKQYASHFWSSGTLLALRGASLEAYQGEIFGLLGPNGAGKTTMIKILLGVVRPSSGTAKLFDLPAGSAAARSRIGYLPESLRIDRHHTARSALFYYGRLSRLSDSVIRSRIDNLIELVGLKGRENEPVRRFSKGMYQRLGLAQTLLHDPDLLILDEPTDGLDPVGRNEVRRLLLELKARGKTIFLNSHILQEVEMVCDRVAIMSQGKVRGSGTIEELTRASGGRQITIEVSHVNASGNAIRATHLRSRLELLLGDASAAIVVEALPQGATRIRIACDQQSKVDAVVDSLRQDQFSILALKTNRPALEDVFLSMVGSHQE